MTATATDIDTTVLEELEFEPPCEIRWDDTEPECDHPAKWIMTFVAHCKGSPPLLVCEHHKEQALTTANAAICKTCKKTVARPFRKAIKNIEPLDNGGGS